ncbi:MAG: ABC transporter permease [Acidobacteriota bacterium]
MSKTFVVMRREFLSTVKRKSYLIVTFGMPFFATIYLGFFAYLPYLYKSRSDASQKPVAIVDLAGIVRLEEATARANTDDVSKNIGSLTRGLGATGASGRMAESILKDVTASPTFISYSTKDEALEALQAGEVDRVCIIPEDYLESGAASFYQMEEVRFRFGESQGQAGIEKILSRSLLVGELAPERLDRVERPLDEDAVTTFVFGESGEWEEQDELSRIARMAIPGVFGILLLMSLMTSAGYLLQGVSEEKENRVIEVILSSIRSDQLLFGKLLGLGGAGLLQLVVWVTVTGMATSIVAAAALAVLDAYVLFACFVFFVLGYLMIGSLMTGTGALGTSARESQQLAAIWSLATVIPPAATFPLILEEPNGLLARCLGWFPLSAPITMMIRIGTGQVPLWDILVAILCLLAAVYLSVRLAAALFRLGLLMHGSRPSLKQIIRQLRHA